MEDYNKISHTKNRVKYIEEVDERVKNLKEKMDEIRWHTESEESDFEYLLGEGNVEIDPKIQKGQTDINSLLGKVNIFENKYSDLFQGKDLNDMNIKNSNSNLNSKIPPKIITGEKMSVNDLYNELDLEFFESEYLFDMVDELWEEFVNEQKEILENDEKLMQEIIEQWEWINEERSLEDLQMEKKFGFKDGVTAEEEEEMLEEFVEEVAKNEVKYDE